MKKTLSLVGVLTAAMLLSACTSSTTDPDTITYEKITDAKLAVEFEKPTGWYENIDSETDPDVYQYIVPNQFSQDDRVEGYLAVYKLPVGEGATLDEALTKIKETSASMVEGKENYSVVTESKDVTIMGQPGKEMVVKYDVAVQEDKKTTFKSTGITLIGANAYFVEFYDEETDYNKYMAVKDKLYSTLKSL